MSKPIDEVDFWKARIDTAVKPHYSVYVIHEQGWKKIYNAHVATIRKLIPMDAKVLDAGCGYGRMSELFNNYLGVDFSPDFIKLASEKYPNKDFMRANLKELPLKDKSFDWSICVSIKRMIQDNLGNEEWSKMEKELKRVSNKILILEYEDPFPYEIL